MTEPLLHLVAGERVLVGGDRFATVSPALAAAFLPGDRLVVVHETGDLLHIPAAEHLLVRSAVGEAAEAFAQLAEVDDDRITEFFEQFAARLADDSVFGAIGAANEADVASATGAAAPPGGWCSTRRCARGWWTGFGSGATSPPGGASRWAMYGTPNGP